MRLLFMTQAIDLDNPVLGFTHQWVCQLATHFEHIHVIARLGGRHKLPPNVTLHAYATPQQPDVPLRRHAFFQRKLAQLILGNRVDTIFIHMIPKWVLMAAPYAKLKKRPLSLWYTHVAPSPTLKRAHRFLDYAFTAAKESYHISDHKVHALGHGIDTDQFQPAPQPPASDTFQLLMVGRLSPVKQIDRLITAVSHLAPHDPRLRCRIVGGTANPEDSAYRDQLLHQIETLGLTAVVTLTGPIPYAQIQQAYHQSHLLINLTQANSFDKAVLEAMACGLPVISSNPSFFPMFDPISPDLSLKTTDPSTLASQIRAIMTLPAAQKAQLSHRLRQAVMQQHNLTQLMAKIAAILQKEVA